VHAVTDAMGSIYALEDAAAVVQARYTYDAYGARTPVTETASTTWGSRAGERIQQDLDTIGRGTSTRLPVDGRRWMPWDSRMAQTRTSSS
jgi:hypothetical protein